MDSLFLASSSIRDPHERMDYWRDVVCRRYTRVQMQGKGAERFDASCRSEAVGALELSEVRSSGVGYRRGPDEIRLTPADHFIVSFKLAGNCAIEQGDRQARLRAGDIVIYDTARPYPLDFDQPYHELLLRVPRPLLSARVPRIERLTARPLSSATVMGRVTAAVLNEIRGVWETGLLPDDGDRLASTVLDVLANAIESELGGDEPRDSRQAQQLRRIKQYLLDRIDDAGVSVEDVADALGMGPRTVHRLFAAESVTAMRWFWQQRLQAAYRVLAEGRTAQVTDAALQFGFSDFSHFSRAFKRQFGVSPNTVIPRRC